MFEALLVGGVWSLWGEISTGSAKGWAAEKSTRNG
jgi:hypothetical protein